MKMKSSKYLFFCLLAALLFAGCKKGNLDMLGMFYTLSEGAEERFAQSMEYNRAHGYDTVLVSDDNYRVYVFTDIHVDTTTFNLDTFTNTYLGDTQAAPFCICLGDQINAVNNYPKFFAYMDKIRNAGRTVYATPGNHDLYYNQWQIYRDYWHTGSYYVVVVTPSGAKDFYLFLDSSDGTFGTDLRHWAETTLREAAAENYRHRIVCTHTHFWKIDQSQGHTSNYAMEEVYDMSNMFSKYKVEYVLQGHSHHRNTTIYKDVTYLRLDKMEDHYWNAYYTIFEMGKKVNWDYIPVGPCGPGMNEVRVEGR